MDFKILIKEEPWTLCLPFHLSFTKQNLLYFIYFTENRKLDYLFLLLRGWEKFYCRPM